MTLEELLPRLRSGEVTTISSETSWAVFDTKSPFTIAMDTKGLLADDWKVGGFEPRKCTEDSVDGDA